MGVPLRHIRHQGAVLAGFGRLAATALRQRLGAAGEPNPIPGPEFTAVLPPRDPLLVRDYVRWCGGDPAAYGLRGSGGRLPPHLFPQWGFPLLGQALSGVAYPLARVLNGGCRGGLERRGNLR